MFQISEGSQIKNLTTCLKLYNDLVDAVGIDQLEPLLTPCFENLYGILNYYNIGIIFHNIITGSFLSGSYLKWYYDENRIFPIAAILKHKQVVSARRKMLFTLFKYLFSFQRYSSF